MRNPDGKTWGESPSVNVKSTATFRCQGIRYSSLVKTRCVFLVCFLVFWCFVRWSDIYVHQVYIKLVEESVIRSPAILSPGSVFVSCFRAGGGYFFCVFILRFFHPPPIFFQGVPLFYFIFLF